MYLNMGYITFGLLFFSPLDPSQLLLCLTATSHRISEILAGQRELNELALSLECIARMYVNECFPPRI